MGVTDQDNSYNYTLSNTDSLTFRYLLISSSYCMVYKVSPAHLVPHVKLKSVLQRLCDPRLPPQLLFIPNANLYHTKQMTDYSFLRPTLSVLSHHVRVNL